MAKLFMCGDLLNTVTKEIFFSPNMIETINKTVYAIANFEVPVEKMLNQ